MKKILIAFLIVFIIAGLIVLQKIGILNKESVVVPSNINSNSSSSESNTSQNPISNSFNDSSNNVRSMQPMMDKNTSYKDGTYTGKITDAFYGNYQVKAIIAGGKISDIQFLLYPNDRGTSIEINTQAMPILKQEAITSQNASVDIVTGATQSSIAFKQSLQSALDQAI